MLTAAKNLLQRNLLHQIQVPKNVDEVIACDSERECDPADAGLNPYHVQTIWEAVVELYKTGMYPGLAFCLRRQGEIVLNRTIGHSHGNGPKDDASVEKVLLTPQTPICLFSSSKAVTAVIMHMLVERKLIKMSDPVSLYLPRFSSHGKDTTTIHQMLSHQGGIPVLPSDIDIELEALFDEEKVLNILYDMKPAWAAGRKTGYHAVTSGFIFGEIVKAVTGKDLRSFINETIREPLEFRYFNYGVEDKDLDKVALDYFTGIPLFPPLSTFLAKALGVPINDVIELCNDYRFMQAIIPSANIISTAEEISAFYQILLNGGTLNGKKIMEPETVQNAIRPVTQKIIDHTLKMPIRYSAGLMLGSERLSLYGPNTSSAYGHLGFANNFCWADPQRDITVSLLTTGNPILGNHIGKLFGLLGLIADSCPTVTPQ